VDLVQGFRTSSPGRQILIAAIVAVGLCALLTTLYFTVLRKPYSILFSNLRAQDAATIVAELDKKKVPYHLEDGGTTIKVPQALVDSTRLAVTGDDLPLKGTVGFELFNKSDMGLTEFAQRINYQRALQGELARTIMTMDAVDTARIHLSLAEPTVFQDDRRPSKASVEVVPRTGRQVLPDTVRGIQRLVAAAVPDLSAADVVVLDQQGKVISGDAAVSVPADAPAAGAPTAQEWRAVEQYYAARVRHALSALYPNGETQVSVSAQVGALAQGADPAAALDRWTPKTRDFGLKVAVILPPTATPDVQLEAQTLAGDAIGLNSALGDTVALGGVTDPSNALAAPLQGGLSSNALASSPQPRIAHAASPTRFWLWLLAPLVLGLLFVAMRLARRRGANLSEEERRIYAQRFQALLEQGEARAAPRV
jgi:flagellar M-ring protein FliF